MQKLRNSILEKLIDAHVTSAELNLLLYMSRYQSARGNITGVYYKDACETLKMSYQGFYDALRGLQQKNIIMVNKCSWYDWDVLILDNDFTKPEAYSDGYISTGHDMFGSEDFYDLKANEKLLAMYLLKVTGAAGKSFCIGTAKFYSSFSKKLRVTKRIIQGYLCSLKRFFSIGIKNRKYYMLPKQIVYKAKTATDKVLYAKNLAAAAFRRNLIKEKGKPFRDIVNLALNSLM